MASIRRYLSPKVKGDVSEIFLRVSVMRGKVWRFASGIYITPARMRDDGSIIYPRANRKEVTELRQTEARLGELEQMIYDLLFREGNEGAGREMIKEAIGRFHHPERYGREGRQRFFGLLMDFLEARAELSRQRRVMYLMVGRCLYRYERHRRDSGEPGFALDVDTLTASDLEDFERFYLNEWRYYDRYPEGYTDYPEGLELTTWEPRPKQRGSNSAAAMMHLIATFFNWLRAQELTGNNPLAKFHGVQGDRYGTPYYLTIGERDRIADFDLSDSPRLEAQRDIFIFQCHVGCRVSDLMRLTGENIVGDMLQYVALKTRRSNQRTVRVPLTARAKMLTEKYRGREDGRLFPFINTQDYNKAIREICRRCGIDRVVTVINPVTGEDERKPLHEVASSHMARRTFIGNLYRKVKDPNLVGALSGHKEGSKAFARYRDIDDDIRKEIIDFLE